MDTPADRLDRLEQRIQTVTRSGRRVRPPARYEPDPDQILEDDFSDATSDADSDTEDGWGYREEVQNDQDIGEREDNGHETGQSDFTDTESRDSSYESIDSRSSASRSTDDDDENDLVQDSLGEEDDDFFAQTDEEEDDFTDVLEWDTLTVDASDDNCSSDDDQDL